AQSHVCLFQDISAFSRLRLERDRLLQIGALHAVLPTLLHELRNPIAAIETTLELLVEEAEGSDKQFDLHALLGEVRRVKLSLQGVGVAADLRANGYAVIDEAIADVVRVMARRAEQYGISVVAQVEAMPLLPFEPGVMRAVVFNLVDNAVTASPKGSEVTVSARLCTADIFELVVADQGRGMSDEVKERATELFYSTKRKGSGIGLALVKRAVSNSGGTMRVESKLDAGTTIKITLPTTTIERPTGLYRRLEDLTTPQ
ncbi:MAG: HAMP domain-containing histidine kinase, partial [Myxococcales bacterium]|nr:HAMP domain-containing histidine kinase [Myxococcales bacterium]